MSHLNFRAKNGMYSDVDIWRENSNRIARNIVKRDFLCDFPTLCICFFFPEMLRHLYFIVKNENSGACGMRETPPRGAVGKMLHDGGHS